MRRPDAARPAGLLPVLGLVGLLVLVLQAGACAPRLAPPGPGPDPARDPGIVDSGLVTDDGLVLPLRHWPAESAVSDAERDGAVAATPGLQTASQTALQPPQPRAVILALHGFNDYGMAFALPAAYWARHGIATYAYDQRGFGDAPNRGLWPGEAALIADLRTAARAVRARHPGTPLFLLGESMGGAVILAAQTAAEPLPGDGVILAAPAVWARSTMPWYQRWALWLSAHTLPWARPSGRGLTIQASDNIEMLLALGRDPRVIKGTRIDAVYGLVNLMDRALASAPAVQGPALFLYGEKDEVVPRDPTLRLWRDLPAPPRAAPRLALYDEGWHMLLRDLKADLVLADIAAWIADPGAPLPSGADRRAIELLASEAPL